MENSSEIRPLTAAKTWQLPLKRLFPPWFGWNVAIPFALTRLVLIAVAWLGFQIFPAPFKHGKWEIGSNDMITPLGAQISPNTHPIVNMWSRWDSEWYLSIAKSGYQFIPGEVSNVPFFPLFPAVVRLAHGLIPFRTDAGWLLLGIISSNAALLLALVYFYRLVCLDYDRATASRAILYLCVFPSTLFLSAFYSESVFLAAVIGAFYYARSNRWIVAGGFCAAATLCRPPGILLIIALGIEYLSQKEFKWNRLKADCLALALAPIALVAHLSYLRWRFGEWDMLGKVESQFWGRTFTLPWNTLIVFFDHPHFGKRSHDSWLDLVCTLVLLFLALATLPRLRLSYAIYAAVSVLFGMSWGYLTSMFRFGVVIFPIVILLAIWGGRKSFHYAYLAISGCIAAACMFVFSHWGWVG